MSGTTSVQVKACQPTCGITASPLPAKAGKPFTVDVSGSRVAAGVKGGVKTAKVEVVDPKGAVVGTYDIAAPNFVNNAVVIKKGGIHTASRGGDRRGGPDLHERLHRAGGREGRAARSTWAPTSARSASSTTRSTATRTLIAPARSAPSTSASASASSRCRRPRAVRRAARREVQVRGQRAHAMFADAAVNYVAAEGFFGGGAQLVGHRQGLGRGRAAPPGRLRPRQGRQVAARRPDPRAVLQRVRRHRPTTTSSGAASASGRTAGSSRPAGSPRPARPGRAGSFVQRTRSLVEEL